MKSRQINWNTIDSLVESLCKKILKADRDFSSITTVSRGGLVPSRLIADQLGIGKIFVDKKKIPSDSLFVDDIYDSGKTFDKILPLAENPRLLVCATLYARKGKKLPKQLIFSSLTEGDEYVIFPWDRLEYCRTNQS